MGLRIVPLASGSNGNSTLVEIGGTRLLVDAGLSAKALGVALESVGVAPGSIDWIVLSHEHHDHARGAVRFSRKHNVPLICSWPTLDAMEASPAHVASWQPLEPGRVLDLGKVTIDPFSIPHDAVDPLGFVFEGEGIRVGVATDVGHATARVVEHLQDCHVLLVESNHDDDMLRDGPYPWHLKERVRGRLGHLSNYEAAWLLEQVVGDNCQNVLLGHLSEQNNTPELAVESARKALARGGRDSIEVRVAERRRPSPAVEL